MNFIKHINGKPLLSKHFLMIFSVIFCVFLIPACSVQPTKEVTTPSALTNKTQKVINSTDTEQNYWWYSSFRMQWNKNYKDLDFSLNLIVAHQIIQPLLTKYQDQIELWRFHRRAGKDKAGHQFSFIFYTDAGTAQSIYQDINQNTIVQQLQEDKIILLVNNDDPNKPTRPNIDSVSDSSWSKEIQKSWPYFIMGTSILWLDLLEQAIDSEKLDTSAPLSIQLEQYKKINDVLTKQWKKHGKHAYFHHMSGIFGYEPLDFRF